MANLVAYRCQPPGRVERSDGTDDLPGDLIAWARRKRHRIVGLFQDEAGLGLGDRPGLAEAMGRLSDDDVHGLVVDRLASLDADLVAQEQVLAEIHRLGARVYSMAGEDAGALHARPADPHRDLVRQVVRAAAENTAPIMALRSALRAANGGSPPFGYRMEEGQLVPEPAEQAALVRIAELRATGATLRQIARTLDAEGHRAKRSEHWHPETLRRIAARAET